MFLSELWRFKGGWIRINDLFVSWSMLWKMGFSTSLQAWLQERELIAGVVLFQDLIVGPNEFRVIGDKQIMEWIESIRIALTSDNIEFAKQSII